MGYPVYYELNFDSFKKHVDFMQLAAHEIAAKAPLSPQEIASMKEMVTEAVEKHNERVSYRQYYQISLVNFGIQYVAYFSNKGEKIIWLNGFIKQSVFHRSKDSSYFESDVIEVEDGGSDYFETIINLTAGKIASIRIHGSA